MDRPNEIRNLNRRLNRAGLAHAERRRQLMQLRERIEALRNQRGSTSNSSNSSSSSSDGSRNNSANSQDSNDNRSRSSRSHQSTSDSENNQELVLHSPGSNQSSDLSMATSDADESDDGSYDHQENNEHDLFLNEADRERYLIFALRRWASEGGVLSMSKLDSLLAILNLIFPNVPKSYKTLLQTPLNTEIVREEDGASMWYKGIRTNLEEMELDEYLEKYGKIEIDVNMDGLPLHRSGLKKFWPILGKLANTCNKPFTIAIYEGSHDPQNVYFYLNDFVVELQDLLHNGFNFQGAIYPTLVRDFILDRPARALVKCCVAHGAYGACEKCEVLGEMVAERMVYLDLNAPLRTDESYVNQTDRVHHVGRSPLEAAGINMVSQFRLDSFHLVYHGAFKRLLEVYNTWPGPWRFTVETRNLVSDKLMSVEPSCPQDFNRKPSPIKFWKHYHGTEERRLCIYDGILVFKNILPDEVYQNYLLLNSAIYVLASPVLVQTMAQTANVLLRNFIEHSSALYGRKFVVLNIHSLAHLAQECEEHGPLENFSSSPFENALKSIKELPQTGSRELQQAARRDQEKTQKVPVHLRAGQEIRLSDEHIDPNENIPGLQYKKVAIDMQLVLALGERDSCFQTKDGDFVVLQNIVRNNERIMLIGRKFQRSDNFYNYPLPSADLGILCVSDLGHQRSITYLCDVSAKCWLMPDGNDFLCVPLLHSLKVFERL